MRLLCIVLYFLFSSLAAAITSAAQIELVRSDYFPAEQEFKDLRAVTSEETLTDAARLAGVENGRLFSEVGFVKYARRTYSAGDSGTLAAEVVTLADSRAAYSLLTLLRNSTIVAGPPGDAFSSSADSMIFAQGDHWVRIQGVNTFGDLAKRVALSISNRIGPRQQAPPLLISHFPKPGYDGSTLRYFLGPKSLDQYSVAVGGRHLKFTSDMEAAQARYNIGSQTGVLSLLSFPTSQVADEYFEDVSGWETTSHKDAKRIYEKKAGPLLALLEGTFDPGTADKILSSIRFTYSIRWIYDRNNHASMIWGVPVGMLGTVVRSLAFVALMCVASIFAGAGFAVFRILLRAYAPGNFFDRPERTEITHLKMR